MQTGKGEIIIYQEIEGQLAIEVKLEDETLWLSQKQIGDLFEKDANTIGAHIRNIYAEEELDESTTATTFTVPQQEGKRIISRNVKFYNLDVILSVGQTDQPSISLGAEKYWELIAAARLSIIDEFEDEGDNFCMTVGSGPLVDGSCPRRQRSIPRRTKQDDFQFLGKDGGPVSRHHGRSRSTRKFKKAGFTTVYFAP